MRKRQRKEKNEVETLDVLKFVDGGENFLHSFICSHALSLLSIGGCCERRRTVVQQREGSEQVLRPGTKFGSAPDKTSSWKREEEEGGRRVPRVRVGDEAAEFDWTGEKTRTFYTATHALFLTQPQTQKDPYPPLALTNSPTIQPPKPKANLLHKTKKPGKKEGKKGSRCCGSSSNSCWW